MTEQQIVNCIGLAFDIIGVILLFFFGIPSDLNKHGRIFRVVSQIDQASIDEWKKFDILSKTGLTLIILGFIFQIFSTCWTVIVPVPK